MNGTATGWAAGALTGLAVIGPTWAVAVWQIAVPRDCCPHEVGE